MKARDYVLMMLDAGMSEKAVSTAIGRALIAYVTNKEKNGEVISRDLRNVCSDASHRALRFRTVESQKQEKANRRKARECVIQFIGDQDDDHEASGVNLPLQCINLEPVK